MKKKLIELRKKAKLTEAAMARKVEELDPGRFYPRHAYAVFEKGGENPIRNDYTEEEVKEVVRKALNCYDDDLFEDV